MEMKNVLTAPPLPSSQSAFGSLKDFVLNGKSLPKLEEGVYEAKLRPFEIIYNGNERVDAKYKESNISLFPDTHLRLELQLKDRMIVDNKFEVGFNIFLPQIKEQLKLEKECIDVIDILEKMVETPFNIWVSYVEHEGRIFRNINYKAPLPLPKEAQPNIDDEEF
jgi:hypothetical protein